MGKTVIVAALVAFIALFWMTANSVAELKPDPPPGAKRAHIDKNWHYTYDAVWTATDGSKIHVRCRMGRHGFRCRIRSVELAPLEVAGVGPKYLTCHPGNRLLRCVCVHWDPSHRFCWRIEWVPPDPPPPPPREKP